MEDARKEIRFYGLKANKALRRQIDRQLQKWLSRHSSSPKSTDPVAYRVCIEREGGSCHCCHLQLQVGSELWESHDVGKSVQDALSRALQHVAKPLALSVLTNLYPARIAEATV
jgi:hypothetical protein